MGASELEAPATQGFKRGPAEDQPNETGRERAEDIRQIMGSEVNPGKCYEEDR
jgi:hypothetical protein